MPFYRKQFDGIGFDPDDFRSLHDLRRLPFTTKGDLRANHPYGLFAVPLRDVVRVHASSGSTGMSTAVGYTRNDLKTWSNVVARVLVAGGVGKDDVVQVAFDYGLFTGAFGFHNGAERVGASVIPIVKAPVAESALRFAKLAEETIVVERSLHESYGAQWKMTARQMTSVPMAPTNAYTRHMLSVAHTGSAAEITVVALPCAWIYCVVGQHLLKNRPAEK